MKIEIPNFSTFVRYAGANIEFRVDGSSVIASSQISPGTMIYQRFNIVADNSEPIDFAITKDVAKVFCSSQFLFVTLGEEGLELLGTRADLTHSVIVKTQVRSLFNVISLPSGEGEVLDIGPIYGLIYNANKYKSNLYVSDELAWVRPHNLLSIAETVETDMSICLPFYICSILLRNKEAKVVKYADVLAVEIGDTIIVQSLYRIVDDPETKACHTFTGEIFSTSIHMREILDVIQNVPGVESVVLDFANLAARIYSSTVSAEITVGFGISNCSNREASKRISYSFPLDLLTGLPKDTDTIGLSVYKNHAKISLGSMRFYYAR